MAHSAISRDRSDGTILHLPEYWRREGRLPISVNMQHPVANVLKHVLVAPLAAVAKFEGESLPTKVCPVLYVQGQNYAVLTHMLAGIPEKGLGQQVADMSEQRITLRDALDFLVNGY